MRRKTTDIAQVFGPYIRADGRLFAQEALPDIRAIPWSINPVLPHAPIFQIRQAPHMTADQVGEIGLRVANKFNWHRIAESLGKPEAADLLKNVCTKTRWRRMQGNTPDEITLFSCTLQGSGGGVVGPLGSHLLQAVVNLIAKGLQDEVVLLEPASATSSACPPPQDLDIEETARISELIKELRQMYSELLLEEVRRNHDDPLRAIALLEDDDLCRACIAATADFKTN